MKYQIILTIISSMLFSGCVYYPQLSDIPLITEKNDVSIDAGASMASFTANLTATYGVTDKIAVQAYGQFNLFGGYCFHGAVGRYHKFMNNTVVELYGGAGYGWGRDSFYRDDYYSAYMNGHNKTLFAQLNYGYVGKEKFEIGAALKSGVTRFDGWGNGYYFGEMNGEKTPYLIDNYFFEPQAFMRFGAERLRLTLKAGLFYHSSFGIHQVDYIRFNPVNLGVSLNYRF